MGQGAHALRAFARKARILPERPPQGVSARIATLRRSAPCLVHVYANEVRQGFGFQPAHRADYFTGARIFSDDEGNSLDLELIE